MIVFDLTSTFNTEKSCFAFSGMYRYLTFIERQSQNILISDRSGARILRLRGGPARDR